MPGIECQKTTCRCRLKDYRKVCAKGSIRSKRSGRVLVVICCPKGKWSARTSRCKVGTTAVALRWPKGRKAPRSCRIR
jgi:hypothetical protein